MSKAPKKYTCWQEFQENVLFGIPSHSKAIEIKAYTGLIETEDQRKEVLKYLDDCLKGEDNKIFRSEINEIKKMVLDSGTIKSGNKTLFFTDPVEIIPALDVLPDGILIVTVPFPAQWEETDKHGNTRTRREILNTVITSDQETFQCESSKFVEKELFAKVPDTIIRSRWPMRSRKEFLSGKYHRDPYEVFQKIKGQFQKYIDFGENKGAVTFCSIYAILTYFFILFDSIPYLKFEGMKGAGKSKVGTIFSFIGFNAVMAVSMTASSIFRTVQDERSTLIMDETENFRGDSEKFLEIMPILNSGFQRTGNAPRVEGQSGNRKTVRYSTYSPKIFCSINQVLETLRDRSYVITLVKTMDDSKANLSVREKDPVWAEIRSDLYLMLFEYYKEVQETADSESTENSLKLIGRDWDKAKPIIALANFISEYAPKEGDTIREDLIDFLKQQKEEEQEVAQDSIEATIITVLETKIRDGLEALLPEKRTEDQAITLQLLEFSLQVASSEGLDITSPKFNKPSYSRKIGRKLKAMGLKRNSRVSHGNFAVFDCSTSDLKVAKERYKIVDDLDPNPPNPPNLPNPPNHPNLPNPNHYPNPSQIEDYTEDVREVREVRQDPSEASIRDQNFMPGRSYIVLKQFSDGSAIYEKDQVFDWDPNSAQVKRWIREGKLRLHVETDTLSREGDPGFSRVEVLSDISVAGKLGDYKLRKGQIIYIEKEQLPMLLKRGAVREIPEGPDHV